jgi:hypothetical protein
MISRPSSYVKFRRRLIIGFAFLVGLPMVLLAWKIHAGYQSAVKPRWNKRVISPRR